MPAKENRLTNQIILKHSKRPNIRLWRNATSLAWVGRFKEVTEHGELVLRPGWSRMFAGLVEGSSDIIGIGPGGQFIAIEVKATGTTEEHQEKFLEMVEKFGGLAGVAASMADADYILR